MSIELMTSGLIKPEKWTGTIIESKNSNEIGVEINIPYVDLARHIFCATLIPNREALNLALKWIDTFDEKSKSQLAPHLVEAYINLYVNMIFPQVKHGRTIEDTFGFMMGERSTKNAWRVISHYYKQVSPKGFSGKHVDFESFNWTTALELIGVTVHMADVNQGVMAKYGVNAFNEYFA